MTTLFAGLVLFSAGAQNTNRIVEEEPDIKVTATVVIEADGAVSKVEITSSPHPALSETVTDCIYRMRFIPAKYDGKYVASVAIIPVSF